MTWWVRLPLSVVLATMFFLLNATARHLPFGGPEQAWPMAGDMVEILALWCAMASGAVIYKTTDT